MTSICPHRHTSYATWRLQVLSRLFTINNLDYTRSSGASEPFVSRLQFHTHYGLRRKHTGDDDTSRQSFKPRQDTPRDGEGATFRRIVIEPGKSKTDIHEVNSSRPYLDNARPKEDRWSPQKPQGREALQDMIAELEILTKVAVKEQKLQDNGRSGKGNKVNHFVRNMEMPESPLERRLRSKDRPPKRQPRREDIDVRLTKNPWAKMLASPMRQCSATKVRLPKDLMSSWGIVRHPETQQDYLMPIELSDMRHLREQMLRDEDQYQVVNGIKIPIKLPTKKISGDRIQIQFNQLLIENMSQSLIKDNGKKTHTASSVLGSNLIPFTWRQKQEEMAAFKRTEKTVDPITGKILPASDEWRKTVPDLQSLQWQPDIHRRLRTLMNERVLIALEGLVAHNTTSMAIRAKRVLAMNLPENGMLKLEDNNVVMVDDEVEKEMMQLNEEAIQKQKGNTEDVADDEPLKMSKTGSELGNKAIPTDVMETSSSTQGNHRNLGNAHDAKAYAQTDGNEVEGRPSSSKDTAATMKIWEQFMLEEKEEQGPKTPNWISGCIFIHVGTPSEFIETIEKWHANDPYDLSNHSLTPPTITIDEKYRIPIFNLQTLLGPLAAPRIHNLTHNYGILDYRFWANLDQSKTYEIREKATMRHILAYQKDKESPDNAEQPTNNINETSMQEQPPQPHRLKYDVQVEGGNAIEGEYLILIKGTAQKVTNLTEEIWRLWRYIGGRTGLWLGDEIGSAMKQNFRHGTGGSVVSQDGDANKDKE